MNFDKNANIPERVFFAGSEFTLKNCKSPGGILMSHVFRQNDIRGVAGKDLTDAFVAELGQALAAFYRRHQVDTISLGYDCRLSSPRFRDLLAKGLVDGGLHVIDIGMGPTPLVYFSLFNLPVGGGVMITGSHNPADENGFKICLGKSTVFGEQIQEIRAIFEAGASDYRTGPAELTSQPLAAQYINYLKGLFHPGPRKIKAVVDAGNGTGNLVAVELYESLGWEIVDIFSEPDGHFPNHHPDPTLPENITALSAQVKANHADLGIAFDGDADRIGVVDTKGRILWGDQLMVIYARDIVKHHPGAKIIGEVKCSQSMFDDIQAIGGRPIMWKVGHSLIKAKMKEENALLAGEMSGHLFFADRYYGYDDAVYAGARLLEILSNSELTLAQMVDQLPKTFTTPEIRFDCPDDQKFPLVERLVKLFNSQYEVIAIDGARIIFEHGWGLVRASNTQPVLVMRFEADSQQALEQIQAEVQSELEKLMGK
jgi:phosphomannomutase/phosphoglucomutase